MELRLAHANMPSFLAETDEWGQEDGCRGGYAVENMRCIPPTTATQDLGNERRVEYYVVFTVV